VSWQLTSFLILAAVLLAGFAWYERSRPPAQVVALVAALAALAIAGRIAFAAFPNVKPTTDIVIFAGYALGGAPGFAVGALAALVSNFWFGQGPWTPWQMAGWGLCGVLGAVLALGTRNAGRFALATVCGFAGILYGALLNFSLMAGYGGELSWKYFWVLEGRAVPFEVAHVLGNIAFALLAGPAMVRMLTRFRERFEWRRGTEARAGQHLAPALRGGGVATLLLVLVALALAPAAAQASAVSRGADWLAAQQRPSGGFAAESGREPGAEMTAWSMLALAAAGRNPLDVSSSGRTPVDFLRGHLAEVSDAGDLARTILALESAGVDPRSFGKENLVSQLLAKRRDDGSYHGWPGTTAYAVLALRAAGSGGATGRSVDWLRKVQGTDGGWGNEPGDPSTAEVTGAVLQVLSRGGAASERALGYMRKAKRSNGGFAPAGNLSANAQATAWASQGLLAAGKDPAGFGDGKSSLSYMRNLQTSDGYFLQAPGTEASPVWVTADVLVPLSGHYLPIEAPARAPRPAPTPAPGSTAPPALPPPAGAPPASTPASPQSSLKALEELGKTGGNSTFGTQPPAAGGGSGGKQGAPPAGGTAPPGTAPLKPGGTLPASPDAATGEQAAEKTQASGSSTAGAILLGLLAGCVLFGAGLAARAGWMRWRYGL
jgi:energy-coupling factor transport system substrate-specific component